MHAGSAGECAHCSAHTSAALSCAQLLDVLCGLRRGRLHHREGKAPQRSAPLCAGCTCVLPPHLHATCRSDVRRVWGASAVRAGLLPHKAARSCGSLSCGACAGAHRGVPGLLPHLAGTAPYWLHRVPECAPPCVYSSTQQLLVAAARLAGSKASHSLGSRWCRAGRHGGPHELDCSRHGGCPHA